MLRELAIYSPTLFYQSIQQFFENIFGAIRDQKVMPVLPFAHVSMSVHSIQLVHSTQLVHSIQLGCVVFKVH